MTEKSAFVQVLGDYPLIRVLNYLLIYRDLDYSLTDIAEGSGVAWSTLNLLWPKMEKEQFVVPTRTIGNAKLFQLNKKNPLVAEFITFADNIVWLRSSPVKKLIAVEH